MNKDAKVRQRYAKICLACSQEKTWPLYYIYINH
jgi:hypothetical protein